MDTWLYLVIITAAVLISLALITVIALQCLSYSVPTWKIDGKGYIITGGSSGIGLATAKELIKKGAHSVTIIARTQSTLDAAEIELNEVAAASKSNCKVLTISADVSNEESMKGAIEKVQQTHGRMDAIICSAGCSNPGYFDELPLSEFERAMKINYLGCVVSAKAVVPHFKAQRSGRIVFVGSMAGLVGVHGYSAYSPSKFAVRGLAEVLAMELKPYNVQISVCNPPDVDTPMYELENKTKPEECRRISESAGLFTAEQLAQDILAGIRNYRFLICSGFDCYVLSILTVGLSPSHSGLFSFLEILALSPLRLVAVILRYSYDSIVQQVYNEKQAALVQEKNQN